MATITTQDWQDYIDGKGERRERPAEPGDFRFEIIPHEEPEMGATHLVLMIDDHGMVTDAFDTDDPYGAVEAAREVQNIPLEERWAMYAERGF